MNGIVIAIDEQGCRVRVEFPDRDNLVSDWLPVGQAFCVGNQEYRIPDEGTQVVCLMDEQCEAGVVLCAIYSDADPPPVTDRNLYYRRFKDGTVIQYDRGVHKLSAHVQGEIEVTATGNITSTSPEWIHNGKLTVTENIESGANVKAAGDVSDQGGSKTMSGMRATYNGHHHGGSATPTEPM